MNITIHGKFSYQQDKIIMIISWYPLYLLIIIFNTILISSLSPSSIELHDLTISISGNKISSANSMFPSTQPLLSVFFFSCVSVVCKSWCFSCFHQHLDDFIPFAEDTAFKRMQLLSSTSVFLLVILATSLLSGDECFMSVIYHIIFSLVRLFCQTIV